MLIQLTPNRKLRTEITDSKLAIQGFSNYVFQLEGTQLHPEDDLPKELSLEIGLDGALIMNVKSQVDTKDLTDAEKIQKMLPSGFEFYHETFASKIIKGVRGKYYHYKHKNTGDIISYVVGAGPSLTEYILEILEYPESKLRQVVKQLPDVAFRKAELVHRLPQSIVENRQPIKAALDILEKEGYVKSISKKGISEEYVRTGKAIPEPMIQKITT